MLAKAKSRKTKRTDISPDDQATRYAQGVIIGEIVAGPYVRAACERHLRDLKRKDLQWDADACKRSIEFFLDVLTVEVERTDDYGAMESVAVPFVLEPWECFIVGSLFGWKTKTGFRRFRRAFVEVAKGNGKALALDTPIATPAGWTTMGEIRPGDTVFSENGQPAKVLVCSEIMLGHDCYALEFDDGARIIADADHLWATEQRRAGPERGASLRGVPKKEWGRWRRSIRTTRAIAETLRYPNGQYQSANHSVPLAAPLQTSTADLLVDPYVMGCWLGDGDSDCARITIGDADRELIEHLTACGVSVGDRAGQKERAGRYLIGGVGVKDRAQSLNAKLRALGLLKNKHIPPAYLRASQEQRAALLQGLMDTDGYISAAGQCEFVSCNLVLAEGVAELITSLGIKSRLIKGYATIAGVRVGRKYRILFNPVGPVFRLERKKALQFERHMRRKLSRDRRIIVCEPIASVPVKCITIDAPSALYLAGRQMVPTHNSPIAAGIGHYMLTAMGKIRAEVYSAATDKDQASILFRDAVSMWERSKHLRHRLVSSGVNPVWQLTDLTKASFFKPISSEKKGKSGIRPYCALIDEVHEHPDNSVIEMMRAGTKGNQDALIFEITNSGFDRKSVCWSEHQYSVEVVTGVKDNDAWFSYVASLDDTDEPFEDETCWIKANPNLGVSIQLPFVREQVAEAKGMPSKEGLVRRLHFCQWTDSEISAIPRKVWMACVAEPDEIDPEALCKDGVRPFGGLDLSRTRDLCAFTLTWVMDPTPDAWRFVSKTWFWTPKDTLAERAKIDRAPYVEWEKAGFLEAIPGPRVSYRWLAEALAGLCARYDPVTIGCDQYGLERLNDQLGEIGAHLPCIVHPQGFTRRVIDKKDESQLLGATGAEEVALWMPDSILKLEAALLEQRIRIDPNPVMNMGAAAVIYEQNRIGHRMFAKDKATSRIDGMVSLAMSIGVATLAAKAAPKYDLFFV